MFYPYRSPVSATPLPRLERRYWLLIAAGFLLGLLLLGPVVDPGYQHAMDGPAADADSNASTEALRRVATAAPVITPAPEQQTDLPATTAAD